jgi:hypothetical protein
MPAGTGIEVVYDAGLRTHESLQRGITPFEAFARSPGTPLAAPLSDWSAEEARFSYATEATVSLAEILAQLREEGRSAGVRAGLEVARGVAKALSAASRQARRAGLTAHGNLSPWRIVVLPDGSPQLLGYGLPDAELLAYLDEQQPGVSLDTLRYAPPERLDDQDEDARSDLYTLAIIVAEMMLGRPVFDGTPTSVAERVIRGDAPELIEALGAHLGEPILDLLCVATEHTPDERFATLHEFSTQAAPLTGDGATLQELAERTLAARPRPTAAAPAPVEEAPPPPEPADDHTLIPPVPPLRDDPTLADVQGHARAIVQRAASLTEQAVAMQGIAEQRSQGLPAVRPLLRRLNDAVARAQKASSSTASTARLVELDDMVADALLTLEMVRSAETLCESATQSALDVLDAVQSEVDEARAEQDLLDRARRQAGEATERADTAADDAERAARALAETYADPGLPALHREQVARARENAEAARSAARRARTTQQTVARHARGADAMRDADAVRSLAEEATTAAATIQRIGRELDEATRNAREELATELRAQVARAGSAALEAAQSLERAREAMASAAVPGMDAQITALERFLAASRSAAERCHAEASSVLDRPDEQQRLADLDAALTAVRAAAEISQAQADEASILSDQVVSKAGQAAKHAAAVSKLRNEIQALLKRMDENRKEVANAWSTLQADTAEVTGRIARDALQVAQRAAAKVEENARAATASAAGTDHSDDVPLLEERVAALREAVTASEERTHKALARCREARGAASRELDEIAERHKEQRALEAAIEKAQGHAERCRAAVEKAWETYHTSANALAEASIDDLEVQRVRAYEVIDIAEFQAGEAAAAAAAAAEQSEAAEALSHASTAASFEERIVEDLPEALEILARIQTRAEAELSSLAEAQTRAADALDAGRDCLRAIEEVRVAGREAARDWTEDAAVQAALEQLVALTRDLDAPLAVLTNADEASRAAESAADAQRQLPAAEAAVRGLQATRTKIESVATALDVAVKAARAEIETRENAVRAIRSAIDTVREMEQQLAERSSRLFAAIDEHQATSELVRKCRKRMRKAVDVAGEAHDTVARANRTVVDAPTAGAAHKLQMQVEEQMARVEAALEAATDAETQGIAAARQEALDRVESERRRLAHARSSSLSHLNTAKQAASKSVALMRESRGELGEVDDPAIRSLHDQARGKVRLARRSATAALGAARRCQRAEAADDAMSHEAEVASLAADALAAVGEAKNLLQEATDLARRQEEEAQALANIQTEIRNIQGSVADGVARASAHATEVVEVTAGSTDADTLATVGRAEELVQSVKLAATKIDAAAPMALETHEVDVAQGLLNTCRQALSRVDTGIDDLRGLVQHAQLLLSQEAERAAARLSEARSEAEQHARDARAIAEKAMGWVSSGERAAEGHTADAVQRALETLRQEALDVGRYAGRAEEAALPARTAPDPETARGVGVQVQRFAADALAAAERTRAALDEVRSQVEASARLDRDAQQFRIAAAEAAAAAELCATDAASVAEELEKTISESGITDDDVATAFREVKRTAKAIATAAAAAFEKTEATVAMPTLADVEANAAAVEERRAEAERLLGELRKQDRTCRETLEGVKRRSRDEAKRTQDEALRARLRRKRNQSTIMKREELKKAFESERDEPERKPEKPNLSALRERLRSRKRPAPRNRTPSTGGPSATEGPRRIGDRPRRRRPSVDGSSQMPERSRPAPDSTSRMRPEDDSEPLVSSSISRSSRSEAEREESRRRRLERRRRKDSISGVRPRLPTSRRSETAPRPTTAPPEPEGDDKTQVGILAPDDLQEAPSSDPREGADALLRRLRRGRRED